MSVCGVGVDTAAFAGFGTIVYLQPPHGAGRSRTGRYQSRAARAGQPGANRRRFSPARRRPDAAETSDTNIRFGAAPRRSDGAGR